jgi:uncharacterized protein (DUF736 family)
MATIGTFTKSGDEFRGEIITLNVQTTDARFVPIAGRAGKNSPSHKVYAGRAEIGAAWRSETGDESYRVTLDDPSFNAPIDARLVGDGDGYSLVWSRDTRGHD